MCGFVDLLVLTFPIRLLRCITLLVFPTRLHSAAVCTQTVSSHCGTALPSYSLERSIMAQRSTCGRVGEWGGERVSVCLWYSCGWV